MEQDTRPEQASPDEPRVIIACPQCNHPYRVPRRVLGKKVVCKECRHQWRSGSSGDVLRTAGPSGAVDDADSGRPVLAEELPPLAGSSSSTIIDMSWAGRRLGRYRILSLLGQGGMGAVWRGHDDTLRRDVAIKILSPFKKRNGTSNFGLELFMQEARAVAKLQHPGVVSIFEVAEDAGQCFLALELMEGGTLKEYIDRVGPIAPREVFAHMVGPAKALDVAHKRGIIHRDIKPGNLMFDDHGHLKLMDFGLADVAYEEVSSKLRGKAVGSLGWVAPETARGKQTTASSDIYSFGLVMMYAMTGKQWLIANSRSKLIQLHQSPPPLVLDNIPGLTLDGEALIRRCLAVEPSERFADAAELAAALQANSEEEQMPMMSAPAPVIVEPKRGVPMLTVLGIGLGIVLGVGAAALIFKGSGGNRGDEHPRIEPPPTMVEHKPAPAAQPQPVARSVEIKTPPSSRQVSEAQAKTESKPHAVASHPPPVVEEPMTETPPPKEESPATEVVADPNRPWIEARPELHPKFIATRNGTVYHLPTCDGGRKIYLRNLRQFETQAEAADAGLKPCRYCHPDQSPGQK